MSKEVKFEYDLTINGETRNLKLIPMGDMMADTLMQNEQMSNFWEGNFFLLEQAMSPEDYKFVKGITVRQLRKLIKAWNDDLTASLEEEDK